MRYLKDISHIPGSINKDGKKVVGYLWRCPRTGTEFNYIDIYTLEKKVKDFHIANNYPLGLMFRAEFEQNLCSHMADDSGHCAETGSQHLVPRKTSLTEVQIFLQTMASWIAGGMPFVDQSLAEKRAKICSQCPLNLNVVACAGCSGVGPMIAKLAGGRHTTQDPKLKFCTVCGCSNKLSVHVPIEYKTKFLSEETLTAFPDFCWQRIESEELKKELAESTK